MWGQQTRREGTAKGRQQRLAINGAGDKRGEAGQRGESTRK